MPIARPLVLPFAAALLLDVGLARAQTPATPPATTSGPAQAPVTPAPAAGDVHETPPPMRTSAPPTPGTATVPAESKTDSKPSPESKPK